MSGCGCGWGGDEAAEMEEEEKYVEWGSEEGGIEFSGSCTVLVLVLVLVVVVVVVW